MSEEKRGRMEKWIGEAPAAPVIHPKVLSSALYTTSELYIWPDQVDSMSPEQAIMAWRIVERLKKDGIFPSELVM